MCDGSAVEAPLDQGKMLAAVRRRVVDKEGTSSTRWEETWGAVGLGLLDWFESLVLDEPEGKWGDGC